MADSWGPRKTVSVFLILAGIGSVLMGVAPNLSAAILGRILVGIGVSTVFVCNFKLLSEWFAPRQFIIMGSAFMSTGGIGALSSSAPLAWISDVIGWRMTFLSVGIITLLMAALVYAFVRNRPSEMGLPPINPNRAQAQKGIGLLNGMKMVVTSGRFWPPAVWAFCVIGISFAIGGLWGGPYLMQVYGHSKTSAGGVLSTFALALIFGSPLLGWCANRFGRKSVLIGCSVMLMVASGIMGFYVDSMTLPALYVLFFFYFSLRRRRWTGHCRSRQGAFSHCHFGNGGRCDQSFPIRRRSNLSDSHRRRADCSEHRTGAVYDGRLPTHVFDLPGRGRGFSGGRLYYEGDPSQC